MRLLATLFSALILVLLTACAGPAPNYSPSIDNVEAIKKSGADSLKTGSIAVAPDLKTAESIALRAHTMVSPVGKNYGDYIAAALRQELEMAKLFSPQATIEISGVLMKNNINAGGMSTNDGEIAVRFVVKRGNEIRFDKLKQVQQQWESSFAGAVAIPLAANNYPVMVQKLIGQLIQDPDFVQAIRK